MTRNMMNLTRGQALVALTFALATGAASIGHAASFGFDRITTNGTENPEAQLSVDVSDAAGQVLFKFTNANISGALPSRISEVYWDDDLSLLSNGPTVDAGNTSAGVDLSNIPASPPDLPSGNTVGFSADFSAGRRMAAANGVDPGEMAGFLFDGVAASVISAINSGDLRIGMHVISIGVGGQSESFVNVPEPATATAAVAALLAVGLRRRRQCCSRSVANQPRSVANCRR